MKILYETPKGSLVATECSQITAEPHVYDDTRWWVECRVDGDWVVIANDLTEQEAKAIVRKLFDYGVYMRCP